MRRKIGTQLILGAGLVTALTTAALAALVLRAHRAALVAELHRSADQLSETIKSSTLHDMLENRRDNLQRQIDTIGRQPGIENVRIYNKEGRIVFSSDRDDVGRVVDKRAEACFACHAVDRPLERLPIKDRARSFRARAGYQVLGIINPIANQPGCTQAGCHAHSPKDKVLGVLDLTMSLAEVDRNISASQRYMAGLALAAVTAGSLMLFWLTRRLVVHPVRILAAATRRVAEGDLTTRVQVAARHELGDLARSFNEMTLRLAEDQRQITQADRLASLGRLAAGVAHEINNPLTGVLTYASLLLKHSGDDAALRDDLEVIVRETKRCRDIVRNLLDFARQTPPQRSSTDLNDVARRALAIVANQIALHRLALSTQVERDLPLVEADANQITQVLVNLLVNAIDAVGEKNGTIRLITRRIDLPASGHEAIRAATCPKGCDLLDTNVRIRGLPSIQVLCCHGSVEAPFHLDPVYGRFNHVSAGTCMDGVTHAFRCPRCRASLDLPDERCPRCGSSVFGVRVPGCGGVTWCARAGCHFSHWAVKESEQPKPVVEIVVEDDGPGIPPSDLPHLFEPFFTTKGVRGTGLGLAVSWGIVEAHGGTLDVTSEQDRGSRFIVRLPLTSA